MGEERQTVALKTFQLFTTRVLEIWPETSVALSAACLAISDQVEAVPEEGNERSEDFDSLWKQCVDQCTTLQKVSTLRHSVVTYEELGPVAEQRYRAPSSLTLISSVLRRLKAFNEIPKDHYEHVLSTEAVVELIAKAEKFSKDHQSFYISTAHAPLSNEMEALRDAVTFGVGALPWDQYAEITSDMKFSEIKERASTSLFKLSKAELIVKLKSTHQVALLLLCYYLPVLLFSETCSS